jgi:T5SS/PEP-CTERM-associated repeat protein/autotransporter-associated beta strand protein
MRLSNISRRITIFHRCAPIVFPLLLLLSGFSTATSAQTTWSDGTGNWFTAANWTNGVPNSSSATSFDARIDNGGTAQILFSGASVRRITLGATSVQVGSLLVDAGSLTVTENLHLGESGKGTVTLLNGGTILTGNTRLARFTGSTGTAVVSGNTTFWSATGDFIVGETGIGSLTVNQGADIVVTGNYLMAESSAPQVSTATFSGAGSSLSVSAGVLRVGNNGSASLTLDTGASITSQDVVIGNNATSHSTASISGTGTTWTMAKLSRAGVSGDGLMSIFGGAKVSATDTTTSTSFILGDLSSGTGTMYVTGAGSTFISSREFDVGRLGTGALTVADGGLLSINNGASPIQISIGAGSKGTLNIGTGGAPGTLKASAVQFGAGIPALNFNHTGTFAFTTPILGDGTVNKFGDGTTTFSTPQSFTGQLNISTGTVELHGPASFSNTLHISIGDGGTLNLFDAATTRAQVLSSSGLVTFADNSQGGTANLTNHPTFASSYLAGSMRFLGHSTAQNATINNLGATTLNFGAETFFGEHASAGAAIITNSSTAAGSGAQYAGTTAFREDSTAASASIINKAATIATGGSGGTIFFDNTTAGNAQITNEGGISGGSGSFGSTLFAGKSAGSALFTNQGGKAAGGAGGATLFYLGDGGTAQFLNLPGTVAGAQGGQLNFLGGFGANNAGHSTINNNGANIAGAKGGSTLFSAIATAGFANITIGGAGTSAAGTTAGSVTFSDLAGAASATFDLQAASVVGAQSALVEFGGMSSGESAKFTVAGAAAADFLPATLSFKDTATAGNANITAKGGGPHNTLAAGTPGGLVKFANASTAGAAKFSVEAGNAAGGAGGQIEFHDGASAGNSTFTLIAPTVVGNSSGGSVLFYGNSTASASNITVEGAKNSNTFFGATGIVRFVEQSTAGTATITTLPASATLAIGGSIGFLDSASAGAATLKNKGGSVVNALGGDITFFNNSSAGSSNIFAEGGLVSGALGSDVRFTDHASAGNATIRIGAGVNAKAASNIQFASASTGGQAAFIIEAGASFNISGLSTFGMTSGSIAGAGNFFLNSKILTTGGLNTSTTVSGSIDGEGGSLIKVGAGTLSLTGSNSFTGELEVRAGKVIITQSFTTPSALSTSNTGVLQLSASASGQTLLKTKTVSTTGNSRIDLTNNKLILSTTDIGEWDGSAYTGVTGLIQSGYHNGAWDGAGIVTSVATSATTLGAARADDVGLSGKNFGGILLFGSDVLVRYTLAGDADLDGQVGFTDLVRVAQNYGAVGTGWSHGDFDYDGKVSFADLVKVAQNYGANAIPSDIPMASPEFESDYAAAFAAVPEPGLLVWMAASTAIFIPRRRLRNR